MIFGLGRRADPERVRILSACDLFENLDGDDLARLSLVAEDRHFADGEVAVREGEPGEALFVVAEGTFRVEKNGRPVATLSAGEVFGEMALVDEEGVRTATVRAEGEARALVVSRDAFEELLASGGATAAKVLYRLCRILSRRLARMTAAAAPESAPAGEK